MKKTALQQLIEQLEEQNKAVPVEAYQKGLEYAIQAAKLKLETEREQIEEAYEDALINTGTATCELERAKEYYKDMYQ